MSDADEDADQPTLTFWEHTKELSSRAKIIFYSVLLSTALMMTLPANLSFLKNPIEFYDPLIGVVLRTLKDQILPANVRLIGVELTAPIQLYVIASAVFGLAFSMPVIAYEAYKFIDPALYPRERKDLYPFVISFSILFAAGAFFGYRVLTTLIIRALMPFYSVVGAEQIISILDFYTMVLAITLLSGASFTIPLFFVLLVKYNIISTKIVTKNRLYLYAALYVVCALITPDGGPGSIIMMMPIVVLMELGVLFAKKYEKGRTSPPRLRIFETQTCRFCRRDMTVGAFFCDSCGKSQL